MPTLEINSFHGGMNLSLNPLLLKEYEASLAKNVDLSEIGTLKKTKGYVLFKEFSTTISSPVNNLYAYYQIGTTTNRFLLGEWNGRLYKYDFSTNSWTQITGTINTTTKSTWITYKNLAIRFNSGEAPKKFDGTTLANLGGNPPQGAYAVVYKDRIYVAGVPPNFSTVYFSDIGNPEAWNPYSSFDVNANDGDQIRALAVLGDSLLIFKENSIWEVQVDQQNVISFKRLFAQSVGTTSARSLVNISNVLYFFDRNGVWAIFQKQPELISAKVQPFINAVQNPYDVVGWAYKNKYHLYIGTVQVSGRTFPNVVLVYDTVYNQWTFNTFANKVVSVTEFIKADNTKTLYFGDDSSYTWEYGIGYAYGNEPIEVEYELPILQPEDPSKRKDFQEILVRLKDAAKSKPSITVSIEGGDAIDLGLADKVYTTLPIADKIRGTGREEGRDIRIKIMEISKQEMNEIIQIVIKWEYQKTVGSQKGGRDISVK